MTTKAELEAALRRLHDHRVEAESIGRDEQEARSQLESSHVWMHLESKRLLRAEAQRAITEAEEEVRRLTAPASTTEEGER